MTELDKAIMAQLRMACPFPAMVADIIDWFCKRRGR